MVAEKVRISRKRVTGWWNMSAGARISSILPILEFLAASFSSLSMRLKQLSAIAVAAALVLVPLPVSPVHDPVDLAVAENVRHVALAEEFTEHGHDHDDGTTEEQLPGHMHGHDPADHSHQLAHLPVASGHSALTLDRSWLAHMRDLPDLETAFGIDRPPKLALSL
jgi:hypothetical protein